MSDIQPASTALLLMDFQPLILAGFGAGAEDILARNRRARGLALKAGIAVMHVRVAFTDDDYRAIPGRNKSFAPVAAHRLLPDASPDAAIDPRLGASPDEPVFTKKRIGALGTTNLDATLKARGIDTLVLAGIHTSGVVLSTLRDAADRDYRLFVLADCCADPDAEVHRVLMEKIFPRQAEMIDLAGFERLLA